MALMVATLTVVARPVAADQYTDKIHQKQQQQQQYVADIAAMQAKIAAAQDQEAALTSVIADLQTQIQQKQADVDAATAQLTAVKFQLAVRQADLARARVELAAQKQELARAVVIIYEMQQQSTPISNLLTSNNFNAFWTSVINGRRISDQELRIVDLVHQQQAQIQQDVAGIAAQEQQEQAALATLIADRQSLDEKKAAQQAAYTLLDQKKQEYEAESAAWASAASQLAAQINQLQQEEAAAQAAGGGSGRFAWPETGPITQGFGCTPFSFEQWSATCPPQAHFFHAGIDIAGPCGNSIGAADAGLAYIEPYQSYGYGNYIIIVHGNGWYTLYGHLAGFAIANGQTVHRGQLIGWEGTTGNSTGCHLHFGVNHNGSWVNPIAYLS